MKNLLTSAACICLSIAFLPNTASSQSDYAFLNNSSTLNELITFYKTSSTDNAAINASNQISAEAIHPKIMKSFNKSYKTANEANWYALNNNKFYLANFKVDGRNTRALYTRNGYMVYSIKEGTEQNLQKDTRRLVKSNYVDYDIKSIKEIKSGTVNAVVMHLRQDDDYVLLSEVDGGLYELEHFSLKPIENKTRKGKLAFPQKTQRN
jgi:hypothetical protein